MPRDGLCAALLLLILSTRAADCLHVTFIHGGGNPTNAFETALIASLEGLAGVTVSPFWLNMTLLAPPASFSSGSTDVLLVSSTVGAARIRAILFDVDVGVVTWEPGLMGDVAQPDGVGFCTINPSMGDRTFNNSAVRFISDAFPVPAGTSPSGGRMHPVTASAWAAQVSANFTLPVALHRVDARVNTFRSLTNAASPDTHVMAVADQNATWVTWGCLDKGARMVDSNAVAERLLPRAKGRRCFLNLYNENLDGIQAAIFPAVERMVVWAGTRHVAPTMFTASIYLPALEVPADATPVKPALGEWMPVRSLLSVGGFQRQSQGTLADQLLGTPPGGISVHSRTFSIAREADYTWQYRVKQGSPVDFPSTISLGNTLMLGEEAEIRLTSHANLFAPATATLVYRGWDGTGPASCLTSGDPCDFSSVVTATGFPESPFTLQVSSISVNTLAPNVTTGIASTTDAPSTGSQTSTGGVSTGSLPSTTGVASTTGVPTSADTDTASSASNLLPIMLAVVAVVVICLVVCVAALVVVRRRRLTESDSHNESDSGLYREFSNAGSDGSDEEDAYDSIASVLETANYKPIGSVADQYARIPDREVVQGAYHRVPQNLADLADVEVLDPSDVLLDTTRSIGRGAFGIVYRFACRQIATTSHLTIDFLLTSRLNFPRDVKGCISVQLLLHFFC
jgi:hypothetical protein